MQLTTLFGTLLALGATVTSVSASALLSGRSADRKANEFSSGNCAQGTASYEHHSNSIVDVTMDDTSHSVYLAAGPWYYYDDKNGDGEGCKGQLIGSWNNDNDHPCVNLDGREGDSRRIKCVKWGNPDNWTG